MIKKFQYFKATLCLFICFQNPYEPKIFRVYIVMLIVHSMTPPPFAQFRTQTATESLMFIRILKANERGSKPGSAGRLYRLGFKSTEKRIYPSIKHFDRWVFVDFFEKRTL